jgi:excisionase family DNA binding protein
MSNRIPTADPLLTVEEVADLLQVRTRWVYQHAQTGELPSVRIGKYVRFHRSDLAAFLDTRSTGRR